MPELNSPASASPSMLAGMNPPPPDSSSGGDDMSGRIPGAGSPSAAGAPGAPTGANPAAAKLNTDIQALRAAEASLLEMAQSYPTATKALRAASEALRSAQRQIISSPGQQEPPVPNTTA